MTETTATIARDAQWKVTLSSRLNPNDNLSAPRYGLPVVVAHRTRAEARQWLAEFTAEKGLRVLSAAPSRHGVLCETTGEQIARYSYRIAR